MAAAWRNLIDKSDELELVVCRFKSIGERVTALTAGLGVQPLSGAAATVSEAAGMATAEALRVLESAKAAEAAAARALTLVAVAPEVHKVANEATARQGKSAAEVVVSRQVEAATAARSEVSTKGVAQALEVAAKPTSTADSKYAPS